MNGNRKRKLQLNRSTVRVLSSSEMSGVAGGATKVTALCAPKPKTDGCPGTITCAVRCRA